jgi:hypothetical protein
LKATLQGFGVQDTAQPGCCRPGAAVFSEALRESSMSPERSNPIRPQPNN